MTLGEPAWLNFTFENGKNLRSRHVDLTLVDGSRVVSRPHTDWTGLVSVSNGRTDPASPLVVFATTTIGDHVAGRGCFHAFRLGL